MKNMQIAGTGNSRFMKSAISETATWEEFRAMLRAGTFAFDFNGINEAGITEKGTPYNVDSVLKTFTAEQFGNGDEMVPDDAFALFAPFTHYYWRRRTYSAGYYHIKTLLTSGFGINNNYAVYYADSFTYDDSTKKYTLVNPAMVSSLISYANTWVPKLRGKYVIVAATSATDIYYVDPSATYSTTSSKTVITPVYSMSYQYVTDAGEWERISSPNRSAYPDTGTSAGYQYEYLGTPLDNSIGMEAAVAAVYSELDEAYTAGYQEGVDNV